MPDDPRSEDRIQTLSGVAMPGPAVDWSALDAIQDRVKSSNIARRFGRAGVIFLGIILVLSLAAVAPFVIGVLGIVGWVLIPLFYCWMLIAFLQYRQARQEELWQVLTTAVQASAPLPQALRAYLRDRPHGLWRNIWSAVLLWFVFPGYYWIWYIWNNYDRKVTRLSFLLDQGIPLPQALLLSPGVVPGEIVLAATVGEVTGQTARCLQQASPRRVLAVLWIEMVPRLLYPLALLLSLSGVLSFLCIFIVPKIEKIYRDFRMRLPWLTDVMISNGSSVFTGIYIWTGLNLLLLSLQLFSTTLRWYFPLLGWVYRRSWQGQVLRLLAVLLDTGHPALTAVLLLSRAGAVPPVVLRRLHAVALELEEGEPLGPSLSRQGLLPEPLVPLVQSAERSHQLPRALGELGQHLTDQPVRAVRWFSEIAALAAVLLMGVLCALVAAAIFMSLVKIMETLSE